MPDSCTSRTPRLAVFPRPRPIASSRSRSPRRLRLVKKTRPGFAIELEGATTAEEITERAGHVLAAVSRGLGIIVMPPLAHTVLEHIRFLLLPDGRVVVVLISVGGATRDKVLRPEHEFTQIGSRPHGRLSRTATTAAGRWRRFAPTCLPSWLRRRSAMASFCRWPWNFAIPPFSRRTGLARCTWRVPRSSLRRRN